MLIASALLVDPHPLDGIGNQATKDLSKPVADLYALFFLRVTLEADQD